ncbi:isochorismatase family protein [Agromyces allii]|uniref:Isochorismatase family protein n=1 Tax=Agromyces allii TaxID=393607 RepID=A0ABN2QW44_9MICO|nr:isochorismatase family protein [Agromyces allii]
MTLSTIDPTTALVVIDLQHLIVARYAEHGSAAAVAKAAELADAFRERGLPVVLVRAVGQAPGRTEQGAARAAAAAAASAAASASGTTPAASATLPPEAMEIVAELEGSGIRITKRTWGAFHGTDLHEQLQAAGVTQIVLAGIATTKGVESTGRAALEHGYHVTFATDAMTDDDLAAHRHSIDTVFPGVGETGTTAEVIALLP